MARFKQKLQKMMVPHVDTGELVWGGDYETVNVPFTPEEEAERDAEEAQAATKKAARLLEETRTNVKQAIRTEALSRMATELPEMTDIEQLATIWRMTVPAARSTAATTAKAVYDVAKTEIAWANDGARTQAELDAYDATTNPAWP